MALTDQQIDAAVSDRFRRWGRFLRQRRATPILVVGLQTDDSTLTVSTVEDMADGQLCDLLTAAATILRRAGNTPETPDATTWPRTRT